MAQRGKPYQSCLEPYEDEIIALRRETPPVPYKIIAEYMREEHQIEIRPESIFYFIKRRVLGLKRLKYDAWTIKSKAEIKAETEAAQTKSEKIDKLLGDLGV